MKKFPSLMAVLLLVACASSHSPQEPDGYTEAEQTKRKHNTDELVNVFFSEIWGQPINRFISGSMPRQKTFFIRNGNLQFEEFYLPKYEREEVIRCSDNPESFSDLFAVQSLSHGITGKPTIVSAKIFIGIAKKDADYNEICRKDWYISQTNTMTAKEDRPSAACGGVVCRSFFEPLLTEPAMEIHKKLQVIEPLFFLCRNGSVRGKDDYAFNGQHRARCGINMDMGQGLSENLDLEIITENRTEGYSPPGLANFELQIVVDISKDSLNQTVGDLYKKRFENSDYIATTEAWTLERLSPEERRLAAEYALLARLNAKYEARQKAIKASRHALIGQSISEGFGAESRVFNNDIDKNYEKALRAIDNTQQWAGEYKRYLERTHTNQTEDRIQSPPRVSAPEDSGQGLADDNTGNYSKYGSQAKKKATKSDHQQKQSIKNAAPSPNAPTSQPDGDCCWDPGYSDKSYGDALEMATARAERVCSRKGANLEPVDLYHEKQPEGGYKYKIKLYYKCGSKSLR